MSSIPFMAPWPPLSLSTGPSDSCFMPGTCWCSTTRSQFPKHLSVNLLLQTFKSSPEFHWNIVLPVYWPIIYGCVHSTTSQLGGCNRICIIFKPYNIYYTFKKCSDHWATEWNPNSYLAIQGSKISFTNFSPTTPLKETIVQSNFFLNWTHISLGLFWRMCILIHLPSYILI